MSSIYRSKLKQLSSALAAIIVSVGTASFSLLNPAIANAANPTTFFDIGTLGGSVSQGLAINEGGSVAGWSRLANGDDHGFIWDSSNGIVDLGTLGGSSSHAQAINDSSQVVGYSTTASGSARHAFIWNLGDSSLTDLGLPAGATDVDATGINNSGVVVGIATFPVPIGSQKPFLWQNGVFTILPVTASNGCGATAVSNVGKVTGSCNGHPFIWDNATGAFVDLGSFATTNATPIAINEAGQIAGAVSSTPFLWDPITGLADLSILQAKNAIIAGMNDQGQIVGLFASTGDPCGVNHAFSWDATTGFSDIGTDGTATHATDINNSSQVAGESNPYTCAVPPETSSASRNSSPLASTNNASIQHASAWNGIKTTVKQVSVGSASVQRSTSKNTTVQFPVSLSVPSTTNVTVGYSISQGTGTAVNGTDFVAKTGTVTFKPKVGTGLTATTLWVSATIKPSSTSTDKTFNVSLSNPSSGYSVNTAGTSATGTVIGNSLAGLRVNVGDSSVWEGDHGKNGVKVWVTLSSPAPSAMTVQLSLANGTATSSKDYNTFATKTISFAAGQSKKVVAITTNSNMLTESDKTFSVVLTNPSVGLNLGKSTGTVTILNDD